MIYKTLHRKLNIEQHEPHYKTDFKIKTTLTTGIKDKYKGCEWIYKTPHRKLKVEPLYKIQFFTI